MQEAQVRSIRVTGEADVRIVPDEAILSLGIEKIDPSIPVAKEQHEEIVRRAIAVARDQGIEARWIQTDHLSVAPVYRYRLDQDQEFAGYQVRQTVVLTVRDLSR